ncbi:MAG: hypothetical protein WBB37_08840 [bacterium]
MKIIYYISSIVAIISLILAVVARLFLFNKSLWGLSALSYLRFTTTMLLFTLVALVFEYVRNKKKA